MCDSYPEPWSDSTPVRCTPCELPEDKMDTEIEYTIRNATAHAMGRGVDTITLMRAEYRLRLDLMVERGYGDAATLNGEASEWAFDGLGPCPTDTLERAAWWTIGLSLAFGAHEYADRRLA